MKKIILLAGLFFIALTGFALAEYVDNGDLTITDTSTNLMWQKLYSEGTWDTATAYCSALEFAGHDDWRLPELTELQGIVSTEVEGRCINSIFASPYYGHFWGNLAEGDYAWKVSFYYSCGQMDKWKKTNEIDIRCVRGATTPPGSCVSVGSDLSMTIPCVEFNGVQYILKLKYSDPLGTGNSSSWVIDSMIEK